MAKCNTEQLQSDGRVLFVILLTLSASLLVWTCILVYDIQKDVNQIKKTLLEIEEILEPIEHIIVETVPKEVIEKSYLSKITGLTL